MGSGRRSRSAAGGGRDKGKSKAELTISPYERGFASEKGNSDMLTMEDLEGGSLGGGIGDVEEKMYASPPPDPRSIVLERMRQNPVSVMQAFYTVHNPDKVRALFVELFCVYISLLSSFLALFKATTPKQSLNL